MLNNGYFLLGVALWCAASSAAGSVNETLASQHWAFRTPVRPPVPAWNAEGRVANPIDAFVFSRLAREKLLPSPAADRSTLIRRLSLDLLGLPPTPAEVEAFLSNHQPDAYQQLVEEFLASPHFGEQWGRHWLDLARYADSDGYEKDGVRPYAYLYRDWVIRAINADLPFDQFTIQQLAGDLLPEATLDQKIATGFHRQTLLNKEGGVDQEEFRSKAAVDRAATTGTVWLGLTVGCAECHDHKYDPVSQREFYQFYAFFNQAQDDEVPAPTASERSRYQAEYESWRLYREQLETAIAQSAEAEKAETLELLETNGEEPREIDPERARLAMELERHLKAEPPLPARKAAVLSELPGGRKTRVHVRGDFLRPGEEVFPGTFAVLPRLQPRGTRPDRLDLGRWLMEPGNPLTARVAVNHLWRHLFGRGLVSTENDFGMRGERPFHPELLDWLATEFQRLGWSRKALLRSIVHSATYQQSSWIRTDLDDPANILLARQSRFRLPAENVRDAFLAASGILDRSIGGSGIRPPLPADIAALGYANSVKWKESEGTERYRRGMYIFFQRTVPYPMLTTFDAPDSNVSCTRRERSNTPLQALTLLNDPVFFGCAQALGRRVEETPTADFGERLESVFLRCLARKPTPAEHERLERFYTTQLQWLGKERANGGTLPGGPATADFSLEAAAWVMVGRIILNLDEFITRE